MNSYNNMIAKAAQVSHNASINPALKNNPGINKDSTVEKTSFNQVLENTAREMAPLQFSKHASLRINSREIDLSPRQLERVENGVNEARQKGIKDSLVLVDNVALLVNIPTKTVVTAINQQKQNIFTNIDGTVIV